jgi:hypothetical protein
VTVTATSRGHLRWPRLAVVARSWRSWGPLAAGAVVMAYGISLHAGTFTYDGPPTLDAFNSFASAHLGAYSDIASLYFRNHMGHQSLPYWNYSFEDPVGTAMIAWLTTLVGGGIAGYMAANAAVLAGCGLLTIWLLRRLPRANPWLLALAPALALYVALNWDLISIAALTLALVLFLRRRDGWASVALAVATWTKFFPILALPVLLWIRLGEQQDLPGRARVRATARLLGPFALVTALVNVPFLFDETSRPRWSFFFRFNSERRGSGSLWQLFGHGHVPASTENLVAGLLLLIGVAALLAAMAWARDRRGAQLQGLVAPALLACFGWFFLTTKLYNPQYDLWVMVLVAASGAPLALAVAFAAADLAFFTATFTQFRLNDHWFEVHVARLSIVFRAVALVALVAWAVWTIVAPRLRRSQALGAAEPEPLPALTGARE